MSEPCGGSQTRKEATGMAYPGRSGNSALSTQHSALLRLGCLPYLNVKPLVYPFEHGELPEGWDMVYATPSTLARMLVDGRLDAAPVSSFACLSGPQLHIVPEIGISSLGPVKTVLMLSKVQPSKVKSVAADSGSLSGRSMLKIVLSENYSVQPEFVSEEPNVQSMLSRHDAALVIGNPAMLADKAGLHVLDLGEEWMRLTGLPAVFAVWAGQEESLSPGLVRKLAEAKESGLERIEDIATRESKRLGITYEVCYDYLTNVMRYDLGDEEVESLRIFGRKLLEHRLVDERPEVRVVGAR